MEYAIINESELEGVCSLLTSGEIISQKAGYKQATVKEDDCL
jgi:hypothetical protein